MDGELEEEYIYRICQSKDVIGTWQDVADILNKTLGFEYTESKYRKQYQAFETIFEANKEKFIRDDDTYLRELEAKKEEIQKERYKIQATKIELNRNLRQDSRFDLFYENVRNAIITLDPPKLNYTDNYVENEKEYCIGFGDFHYGATFKSENNEYSREICKLRLEKLLSILIEEIDKNNINKLKIINVSDTIQGILRMTDLQINDIPIVECVVEVSRLLAEFLNELSAYCNIEYYHCAYANHTQIRPLGSKANEIASEDLEKIIVSYISDLLSKNKNVNVISDLDKQYLTFDIFDFKAIVLHGHQLKSVPNTIKDLSNLHRTFYDYAFLGHRHSANEIIVGEGKHHNIEILTCPSFVGSDPYADKLMVGGKSMCKLYEFDKVYGHVGSKNIILN